MGNTIEDEEVSCLAAPAEDVLLCDEVAFIIVYFDDEARLLRR